MQRFFGYSRILATGAPAPGCTITVHPAGDPVTLASIFEDADGVTPKANPFTADAASGFFDWYAVNGRYDNVFSGTGIVTPYTWADIVLADVGGNPIAVSQAELGGSQSAAPAVDSDDATVVAAVGFLDVTLNWPEAPGGLLANVSFIGQAPLGGSLQLELYDLVSAGVVLQDPVPLTDSTQFVTHVVQLPAPDPLALQNLRLRATVIGGMTNPGFFFGRIIYSL